MRTDWRLSLALALFLTAVAHMDAQDLSSAEGGAPLVLTGAILLPNVQGRIDHMSFDPKGRLFVSALGNNTVEILDLSAGIRSQSIAGIPKPQGVLYCQGANKLFVGSDEGKLYIYDATSFSLITSIDFGDDVDNLRYDPSSKNLYVGYGDEDNGAIAVVNVITNKRLPREFKLGAHPESFQLEATGPNIYVNVPDLKQIAVINRNTGAISRWPVAFDSNFPMALDEADHRLFVATRAPARLAVFDTNTGRLIASLPCVQNSDDVYYDGARKRVYVPGGEGYISVIQAKDEDHYVPLERIPAALGARTGGYFGKGRKSFDLFYVAVPARVAAGAEVLVYTVQN